MKELRDQIKETLVNTRPNQPERDRDLLALPQSGRQISSGRVFMINTRAQRKLLQTWIVLVIVKRHLVQLGRIDGPTEYLSQILAAIRSLSHQELTGVYRETGESTSGLLILMRPDCSKGYGVRQPRTYSLRPFEW